jgi:NAD-dependent DNA ligase
MKYLPSAYKHRAEKLAIMFLDETSIPLRFKAKAKKSKRYKEDSKIEIEFQETVQSWLQLIKQMMDREFPDHLIHQLIYLQIPEVGEIQSVTEHEDWLEYHEYFTYVRDEIGDDLEIGRLSMLTHAWQKLLERKIERSKGLKDDLAQELMEKGEIELDGHVIKLWRGHNRDTVSIQENWNKIVSIGAINLNKPKDCPRVLFTGIFQIPRSEVAEYASQMGFRVQGKVTKETTYVVIGTENVGPNKIADLIKLRLDGFEVELMEENAFLEMVLNTGFKD